MRRPTVCIRLVDGNARRGTRVSTRRCYFRPFAAALPGDDPRSEATLAAVETELAQEGYIYRYRQDERSLGEAEGAFLLCGFLMALGTHQQGREVDAVAWFERNRSACGPPGLLTEEFDVGQRQLRGNVPQAFVHALLFECAARLAKPWNAT